MDTEYNFWDTDNFLIEVSIDNVWWQKEITKAFNNKINFILNEIINLSYLSNLLKIKSKFSISLLLTDDLKITQLNKKFKNIAYPTNVLSFPSLERNINLIDNLDLNVDFNFLGDIVMSSDTIIKEANLDNKIVSDHLTHLFIHGVLHLLGYDHINNKEADIMEKLEINILFNLGIENPYF